jgi:CheY-like chemotaxis protein/glycine cleavage system H lipoate-binding protein
MKTDTEILVIDDEEVILEAVKKIAASEDLKSDTCLNVKDALANLNEKTYQLIICDIMMPDVDGFELLKIVKQKKISTPVVITTGFSTLENAVKALYEGAVGFIPKPFTIEELISIIKRGIEYGKLFGNKYVTVNNGNNIMEFVPCPPKYYRLGNESWMNKAEEGLVVIGITDLFLKSIGMIEEIEFMNTEEEIYQGGTCLKITDNRESEHQLLSPISGKIIDINNKLVEQHSLLEKDPYFEGWIYKMVPSNLEDDMENITPCSSDI